MAEGLTRDFQDAYGNDTKVTMNMLHSASVRIAQDRNAYVTITDSDQAFKIVNPSGRDRAEDLLTAGREEGETGKEYARRLGITPQELSMFKARASNFRVPRRDIVLKAILGRSPVPDEGVVDHILMELHHPGLFTSTYDLEANRRNEVLRAVFSWLRTHVLPDHILFASFILDRLGLPDLDLKDVDYSVFADWAREPEGVRFLEDCRARMDLVSYSDFSSRRADLRQAFIEREHLEGKSMPYVYDQLYYKGQQTCSVNVIQDFFGRMTRPRSRSARDTIIEMGIKLGCDLAGINTMLVEANYALLYPRSFFQFDVLAYRRLCEENGTE